MAFVTILIILVCVLLGLVVLIQNPKGGGLNASFGGVGQQLLGARRSTDVVEKSTWGFAAALLILCFSTAFFIDKKTTKKDVLPKSEVEMMQMNGKGSGFNGLPTSPAGGAKQPAQPATPPKQ